MYFRYFLLAYVGLHSAVAFDWCQQAEELMRKIEKEEERVAYDQPDKKVYHLCIVNLVIGYVMNDSLTLSSMMTVNYYVRWNIYVLMT